MIEKILFIENGYCPTCKRVLFFTEDHMCQKCLESLEAIRLNRCLKCGREILNPGIRACRDCISMEYKFNRGFSAYGYDHKIKDIIYLMKFGNRPGLCRFAGKMTYRKLEKENRLGFIEDKDLIIPVPLSKAGLNERGYNQSELLALGLTSQWNVSEAANIVHSNNLIKIKETAHQRDLNRRERLKNVVGAFKITDPEKIRGQNILLVDDVMTTGSTLNECSNVLMGAGAKNVDILVFASVDD
ncbi:ComF family protein [Alkalibacter mobilis]|uniref:ComF family protein n=1 Tax=Alkalibacter mobilis TaxID=2787712 RepID=UPI00189E9744|nr:ComF family protein [Alkalibacter mobilis]MBF7095925.1 ComF family protein [Alkalibacter mobilis]